MARRNRGQRGKAAGSSQRAGNAANNTPDQGGLRPNERKLPTEFQLRLEMGSDWHIGSGTGRPGQIDRLVQRDENELPFIPAKSITGIWRDAAELLAEGLGGSWPSWVETLFGDQPADPLRSSQLSEDRPIAAALSIRPARFPELFTRAMTHPDKLLVKQALTFIKPGVSIDPGTGCAVEDFLRFEEMVRGGALLHAPCRVTLPEDLPKAQTVFAFMVASTRLIEQIGGKRRRGNGACCMFIEEIHGQEDSWIQWLKQHHQEVGPRRSLLTLTSTTASSITSFDEALDDNWIRIPLQIRTETPVIISSRTVGNVTESLDYIPGSYLLRWIGQHLRTMGINLGDVIETESLIVTNATVAVQRQPGRPVPFALYADKLKGGLDKGLVYNKLIEPDSAAKGQLKGIRKGYIGHSNGTHLPEAVIPDSIFNTHNTINDETQRPTSDVGGIYTYEGIPTGTVLQAELRFNQSLVQRLVSTNANWWEKLRGNHCLGQSKKDDYGLVYITPQKPQIIALDTSTSKLESQSLSTLTVWLLSDLLLRDDRLRPTYSPESLRQKLSSELKVTLHLKKQEQEAEPPGHFARHHRAESWQVRWGLPRPSLAGMKAGSCFVFNIEDPIPEQLGRTLKQLEVKGLGERRIEGYGQLSFNDPLLIQGTSELKDAEKSSESVANEKTLIMIKESEVIFPYCTILEKAAWRDAIYRACLAIATDQTRRREVLGFQVSQGDSGLESSPPMSQLGALRSVIHRLRSSDDTELILTWINRLRNNDKRGSRWPNGSLDKIEDLIAQPDYIWENLLLPFERLTITRNGVERLKQELRNEAIRTLIGLSIQVQKRNIE